MTQFWHWLFAVTGLVLVGAAEARTPPEVSLPGENRGLAERFEHLQTLTRDRQWGELLDDYQDILARSPDALVPVGPEQSVAARRLVHQRLAALPAEGLRLYRARVDEQARKWLDRGSATRDERLLRRLVDDAFCSRHTDQALDLLGDLAFERGDHEQAERYWHMLGRPDPAARKDQSHGALIYPDPRVDPALVQGKVILSRLFRSQPEAAGENVPAFRKHFGQAEGYLAGRQGNLATILQELADQPAALPVRPVEQPWTTFAGAASRNHIAPRAPRSFHFDMWQARLDGGPGRPELLNDKPTVAAAQGLRTHPVIVQDQVLVADARSISSFDLATGRRRFRCDLLQDLKTAGFDQLQVPPAQVRFTLTVDQSRLYARLGTVPMSGGDEKDRDSYLVCLSLEKEPPYFRPRWQVKARVVSEEPFALFEGAPVVRDNRVHAALTRYAGGQAVTAIACYDADTGARKWLQDICATPHLSDAELRYQHHLLTLAGPNVAYCSHSGAVVALDATSGRPAWAFRYPSRGSRTLDGDPSPRELASCLYADGRLFVAPADADRLFALDAGTGRKLWESKPVEVQHLLGVAQDRLVFTTGNKPRGIRALVASTGDDIRTWLQPDDGSDLPTFGRGFLAGDQVWWPTIHGLRILDLEDGQPIDIDPTRLRHIRPGNMAYGNDCLAVAGTQELFVYVPVGRALERRKKEAAVEPESALAQYRLALALADAGHAEQSLDAFTRIGRLAPRDETWQGQPLRGLAGQQRHELLLQMAEQAAAANQAERTAALLTRAAAVENSLSQRLRALKQLALFWRRQGRPQEAKAIARTVLASADLRNGLLVDGDEVVRGGDWAAAQLGKEPDPLGPRHGISGNSPAVLPPPLHRVWEIPLNGERLLGPPGRIGKDEEGVLVFSNGGNLIGRDSRTGVERWRRPFPTRPTWVRNYHLSVLAGSPQGVWGLDASDGQTRWTFLASDIGAGPEHFTDFQHIGPFVCVVQGQRRLFTLEAATGRVCGNRWAPGASLALSPPSGQFYPSLHGLGDRAIIQHSGGWLWLVDCSTSGVIEQWPTSRGPLPQPPVSLDQHRLCLVPDRRLVELHDIRVAQKIWAFHLDRPASLTGEAPQVQTSKNTVLVLIPRNYGYELQNLNPADATPRWPRPLLLSRNPVDLTHACLDDKAAYLVADGVLRAIALADGRPLWHFRLGNSPAGWQVMRTRDGLLVHPRQTLGDLEVSTVCQRFGQRWLRRLTGRLLPWPALADVHDLIGGLQAAQVRRFPVFLCDHRDGQLIQKLNFPARGPGAAVVVFDRLLVVALHNGAWGLTADGTSNESDKAP